MPTPIIEPISVCELEAGRPNHQVPRFQIIAATSKCEDHREAGASADLQNQFHRQQRDDAEGDRAAGREHAEEIPHAGPDHSDVRLHGVRVDDGGDGIGGIVEAVHKFESEGGEQRDAEQSVGQPAFGMDAREISEQVGPDIDEAAQQHHDGD